jgi:hypothetical protein
MSRRSFILWAFLVTLGPSMAQAGQVYSLVVGVNRPLNKDTATLRYADDDAILFHQILSSVGRSVLLVVPDENTRRLHPHAIQSKVPSRANILAALQMLQADVRKAKAAGESPEFYFIYSGHGDVKNNQGYLALAEGGRFTSEDLEKFVLKPSKASANHVIVDACRSYYLVAEKRAGGTRRRIQQPFSRATPLTKRFPRTGFLLSTSSGVSSHEWEEFQAGIFSHEIRSGLLGAADIDGDSQISYQEMWAFIRVANARIANERFRPDVFMVPPKGDHNRSLLNLKGARSVSLTIPRELPGRYSVEDTQGVRLADLHMGGSNAVTLHIPTTRPFFVHDKFRRREYALGLAPVQQSLATVSSRPWSYRQKGAAHEAFTRIFSRPFGADTYSEIVAERRSETPTATVKRTGVAIQHPVQNRIFVGYGLRTNYLEPGTLLHAVQARYLRNLGPVELGLAASYGHARYDNSSDTVVAFDELMLGAVLDYRFMRWNWGALFGGVDAYFGWGWQRAATSTLSSSIFSYRGRLGAEFRLTKIVHLRVSGHVGQAVLLKESGLEGPLVGGGTVALGLGF